MSQSKNVSQQSYSYEHLNVKTHDGDGDEEQGFLTMDDPYNITPATPLFCGIPLKTISLVILALQNSTLTLIMHHSRTSTPPSRTYSAATAVLMNEIFKGLISLFIAFLRVDGPSTHYHETPQLPGRLVSRAFGPPILRLKKLTHSVFSPDCWKLSIPAILYVIQNNLQYVAVSNLEAATFQVTYQMKILTTAAFSVILLRKKLTPIQWLALLFLAIGVGIVQIQAGAAKGVRAMSHDMHHLNGTKGFIAVVAACFISGLAGVYFEMVLKGSQADLWVRNVQLSLFSLLPALAPVMLAHTGAAGREWFSSLFHNFGAWAWATVAVQVLGGLITAMVIKYSDNILKGFATSLSIVISFLASIAIFDFHMTFTFILGSVIVLIATWLYNQPPKRSSAFLSDSIRHLVRNEKISGSISAAHRSPLPPSFSTASLVPPNSIPEEALSHTC